MNMNIDGHEIEILSASEIPPEARVVKFNIEHGQKFGVSVPAHPTKSTLYKFRLDGTNLPDNEYLILQPPAAKREHGVNFAELRPIRLPERFEMADMKHQMQLFSVVGTVAVAGGHVEMAMKKVLVSLRDEHRNLMDESIPGDWNLLERELKKLCDGSSDLRLRLKEILDTADRDNLREERNDIIHGYWWTIAVHDRLVNARYFRPRSGQQPVRIQTTLQAVQDIGNKLFAMAQQLDALVAPDWPIAIFVDKETMDKMSED